MPRRVEDIVNNEHRSIRRISINRVSAPQSSSGEKHHKKKGSLGRKVLFIILGLLVTLAIVAYFMSINLTRAVFTITPRVVPVSINTNYVALSTPKEGSLVYKLIKVTSVASSTVPAISGQVVNSIAKGTINIYNSYSAIPRKLIAGTRFTSDTGLIYKLANTIVLPGYKTGTNGNIIPGTIKSTVVAEKAGVEYNLDGSKSPKSLYIVAYSGGDKYDKIYGQLTSQISGGASGHKMTIGPMILASTTAQLKYQIESDLKTKLKSQIPNDYFMFENATILAISESEISDSATPDQATISIRGTMYGIALEKEKLIAKLAGQNTVDTFGNLPFDAEGIENLSFVFSNKKDFSPEKGSAFIMQLKGDVNLVGIIPIDDLKKKFAGLSLVDTGNIIRSYSPVLDLSKSTGQVVPPWSKIPTDLDKIQIIIAK